MKTVLGIANSQSQLEYYQTGFFTFKKMYFCQEFDDMNNTTLLSAW